MHSILAFCLGWAGRFAESELQIRQAIDLDPNNVVAYSQGSFTYSSQGKFAEALSLAEKAVALAPWFPFAVASRAVALVLTGERAQARALVEKQNSPIPWAQFYSVCGELDLAADWFEKAIEERIASIQTTLQHPVAKPLRDSPRWPKLAKMLNLPA